MLDVAEAARVSVATVSAVINGTAERQPGAHAAHRDGDPRHRLQAQRDRPQPQDRHHAHHRADGGRHHQPVLHRRRLGRPGGAAPRRLCASCCAATTRTSTTRTSRSSSARPHGRRADHRAGRRRRQSEAHPCHGTSIPVVLIDRVCDGVDTDAVVLDNQRAVFDATTYMLELGHRRIGYISGSLGHLDRPRPPRRLPRRRSRRPACRRTTR